MGKNERKSNIELLRIISMLGVIVLHYNNTEIGGGLRYASGVNKGILLMLESVFICAVNLYILISGYFLCTKNSRTWNKPLELLIQVILFNMGFYILGVLLGQNSFSIKGILGSIVPNNYFVILYIVCFMVSPYLNVLLQSLGREQCFRLLVLLLGLFSVYPTAVDVLKEITQKEWLGLSSIGIDGSQGGYTIVNFLLMYCIGAYLKLYMKKDYSYTALLTAFVADVAMVCIWTALNGIHGIVGGSAWEYCNPLVIAEAVILFLIFRRLPVTSRPVINTLAKGAFTVYLLHTAFLRYIRIPEAVEAAPAIMTIHILLAAVVIYLICFLCYAIYEKVTRPIFRRLENIFASLPIVVYNGDNRKGL